MTETSSTTPKSYYQNWVAYDSLFEAASVTSHRSVWECLKCDCCATPHCWSSQPLMELPDHFRARIRWYDNILVPQPSHNSSSSTATEELDPQDLRTLQRQFVGHHQRIELVLLYLQPSLDTIQTLLKPYCDSTPNNNTSLPDEALTATILAECRFSAHGWHAVAELVRGVAHLDRMQYLQYAPRLAGVSGGNSPLMLPLTTQTAQLERCLFRHWSLEEIAHAIRTRTNAGRVAEAMMDCLDALSRCWFDHVVTATTPIGITCGTKGTPNTILVERVLKRLHGSRLLQALGQLRAPITGIGMEMLQLENYANYPLAEHYLDVFVDPGLEFGTHSVGWLPKRYDGARSEFRDMRLQQRSHIWELAYQEIRPAFCDGLRNLIGLDVASSSSPIVEFGLGSSVTEVLWRLLNSIQIHGCQGLSVVLAKDEFVTLQRAAGVLGQAGAKIVHCDGQDLAQVCLSNKEEEGEEKKESQTIRQVVFVSLVNSCTQRVQTLDWVHQLSPTDTIVVIDITQAVANIPLRQYQMAELAAMPNVFLVGSLIKHARCGEGLAFLSFRVAPTNSLSVTETPASGWTAYLRGLRDNTTLDANTNALLYDDPALQWEGGTPAWVESAYVATQIWKSLPSVEKQHDYVNSIKQDFLERAKNLLSEEQVNAVSESNTIAFPVSRAPKQKLLYGLDFKVLQGQTYLRIGFGIQNLHYHLVAFVEYLEETQLLQ